MSTIAELGSFLEREKQAAADGAPTPAPALVHASNGTQ